MREAMATAKEKMAEQRAQQTAKAKRSREEALARGDAAALPARFTVDLMVRFRLLPGWRVNNVKRGLLQRLAAHAAEPEARFTSWPPDTEELLGFAAEVGLDKLADEGDTGD